MKILVTGSNGLLGQKLASKLHSHKKLGLIATSRGENKSVLEQLKYERLDICDAGAVHDVIGKYKPDVVINTAAMTNVDDCEVEQDLCWKINVEAVENLVQAGRKYGFHLIQLSTDFIFDGETGPLTEEASPGPVNFYGESKLEAEKVIEANAPKWSIARTVLVYGYSPYMSRSNIVLWVKENLEKGKTIKVVNDQWRTPTLAEDLASGCILIAQKSQMGIFNISGKDFLSPYQMAIQTARYFKLDDSLISEADSNTFKQIARRPLKTGFNIEKARKYLGYKPHSFSEGIELVAQQMR